MATERDAPKQTRPPGVGFSKEARVARRRPVVLDLGGASADQIAEAIFATAKPPDPRKRRKRRR
ncbi:MAG: hypothetical protein OXU67_10315 [Chloroflexota bacterium]|nr:hypothetical protein [Chloroflexota bacterium]